LYIPNVPFSVASQVLEQLNESGQDSKKREERIRAWEEAMLKRGYVDVRYNEWRRQMWERELLAQRSAQEEGELMVRQATENATLGYVTKDVRAKNFTLSRDKELIFSGLALGMPWDWR
jgi:hypothetical protein